MENKSFKRRYRGLKFFILALLVFTAVGLSYFANGPKQVDASRTGPEEAASSLRAQAGPPGKHLIETDGEVGGGVGDSQDKDRDNVVTFATKAADQSGDIAPSARDAGTPPLDPVSTAADGVDGTPSGSMPAQGLALPVAKIPLQPKSLQNPSALSLTDTVGAQALERSTDRLTASQGDGAAASDQADATTTVSEAQKTFANQASVAKKPNTVTPAKTVGRVPSPSQQTTVATGGIPGAPVRCIGPPPKGKDLGSRYIVASCESLSIISQRTGVRIDDLKDHNPQIKNPDLIFPNQELRLPPRG